MEWLYKLCFGLGSLVEIAQGLFVLYKNPRSRINATWAATSISVGIWSVTLVTGVFQHNSQQALLLIRISQCGMVLIPVFFTHFCLALLDQPLKVSRIAVMGYFSSLGLACSFLTEWFIPSVSPVSIFRYYPDAGPLYIAYTIQFFGLAIYSHWLLFKRLRSQPRRQQNQIKYIAIATLIGYVCGSTLFLPVYGIDINPILSLGTPLYVLLITYAILKHQVMDIKVVITRTGVFLGTYVVVLGAPFAVGWWGKGWLKQRVGEEWWLVPLGLCTVLATIGPFAYAYLRRQVEEQLLKGQRRYQRTLQHAARGMTRVRDLAKLVRLIVRVVSRTVGVQHASLFLWEKDSQRYVLAASHGPRRFAVPSHYRIEPTDHLVQWLQAHRQPFSRDDIVHDPATAVVVQELAHLNAAFVVPGFIEHELVGFLVLGDKLSGASYSPDDLHAFSTLANEASVAIENARSYEELLKVNEQLRLAYGRLVQQERFAAAGQFATGMAHEIKNPLSAIKTFAEYLPEKYQDPSFREKFFRIVQGEIDRINTIVTDLLEFAKPAKPELRPVNLASLLKDILELMSSKLLKQGVELRTAFHENGLSIQADPKQMKQVLLNLLLNSLEAMPAGGRLEVRTEIRDQWLALQVLDTGCGISEDQQYKVFDPFFTTKERGMGLGLAVVKGIVDRHGGEIFIRSNPGQGTTVEVMLPVMKRT